MIVMVAEDAEVGGLVAAKIEPVGKGAVSRITRQSVVIAPLKFDITAKILIDAAGWEYFPPAGRVVGELFSLVVFEHVESYRTAVVEVCQLRCGCTVALWRALTGALRCTATVKADPFRNVFERHGIDGD